MSVSDGFSISFSTKTFSIHDLKTNLQISNYEIYKQKALEFCVQWLEGKQSFVMNTSGSTGKPKSINIERKYLEKSALITAKALNLKKGDSALVSLNIEYIAGMMMLVRGLEIGLKLTLTTPSGFPLNEFDENTSFDFLSFVPLQIQNIIEKQPEKIKIINKAKNIILGGAPISNDLEEKLQIFDAPIYHTYGMTETVSHIALRRLNGKDKKKYFSTLKGVKIKLDDRGCLVIETPTAHEEVITNDLVEIKSEKDFIWLGRIDNVINTGGVKVQAEKIETQIEIYFKKNNLNKRFFVAGLPDEKLGQIISLIVERVEVKINMEEINEIFLRNNFSKYETIKKIIFSENFIQTPTGKIDKQKTIQHL